MASNYPYSRSMGKATDPEWNGSDPNASAISIFKRIANKPTATISGNVGVDFGTAISGESMEAGGTGNLGWLSSIRRGLMSLLATAGAQGDAMVAAGAAGSTSAKLRRISVDLDAVRTAVTGVLGVSGTVTANLGSIAGVATEATVGAVNTVLGTAGDTVVAAGAAGSVSAKLRRLTTDLDAVRAAVAGTLTVGGTVTANLGTVAGLATDAVLQAVRDRLPTALTGAGNLKVGIQESVTLPVSGTVTANLGTVAGLGTEATAGAISTALGTPTDAVVAAGAAGSASSKLRRLTTDIDAVKTAVTGTLSAAVSGTVTANLGTIAGAATDTVLQAVRDRLPTALTAAGNLKVSIQESVAMGVTGTVTANLGTIAGVATDVVLQAIRDRLPTSLGTKTAAGSISVTIASDQAAIPVSGAGGGTTTVDFGTPLTGETIPSGTGNLGWLSAIRALIRDRLPASLGQKTKATSLPVVLASDQDVLRIGKNEAVVTATIASGSAQTGTIDTAGYQSVGMVIPATFTGNGIWIQTSNDGTTFSGLYDRDGLQVLIPISQGRNYTLPAEEIAPWRYIKLQSMTDAASVNQGSARTITVVMRS